MGKKIVEGRKHLASTDNKARLARRLGIARSSLYYKPKKPEEDEQISKEILAVLEEHPSYGHKRIALELGYNKKRILRIMNNYKIRPKIMRGKPFKPKDMGNLPSKVPNIAKTICPIQPNVLWVGDFTYIPWHGGFVYLATVLDVYTREIVGWHIGLRHTSDLVIQAFFDAMNRNQIAPQIFHSDQGSEYLSGEYEQMLYNLGVTPSHSEKGSPWENGYQESFYGNFKLELGNPNRFNELGELAEVIHQQMCYYNQRRIHTSLKMSPVRFREQYENKIMALSAMKILTN